MEIQFKISLFNAFYLKNTKMTSSGGNGLCRTYGFGHLKSTSSESIT